MTKNVIVALVGSVCAMFLCEPHSFGQDLSGTSLNVTGTATVGTLVSGTTSLNTLTVTGSTTLQGGLSVSGPADILGNGLYFGSWLNDSTHPGISITYADAPDASTPSLLTFTATQPLHAWLWEHSTADQNGTVPMMKLDSSHVLTIYDTSGNPAIVLDPASSYGASSPVLTQAAADALYIPANAGLVASNGYVGIGTTYPQAVLDVSGVGYGGGGMGLMNLTGGSESSISFQSDNCGLDSTKLFLNGNTGSVGIRAQYGNKLAVGVNGGGVSIANDGADAMTAPYGGLYVNGDTIIYGNVGVGTNTPQVSLDVQGDARFSGAVRVEPQGDLDMGSFTTDAASAMQQSMQNPSSQKTLSTISRSPAVSGTSGVMTTGTAAIMTTGTAAAH